MSVEVEKVDLPVLNEMFERKDPTQIVEWAVAQFGDEIVMSSSFGADAATLLHMANKVKPGIRVIFVDTGYHFPETLAYMERLRRILNLNVWTYHTRNDPIAYLHHVGEENPTWRKDREACCAANKTEPFKRAMTELAPKAWLRGTRANQTQNRAKAAFISWFGDYNCYQISPLYRWTAREIFGYIKENELPRHPLWEKGYASIGCNPLSCTRPITEGEDPRAGRWSGHDKIECGINVDKNSLDSANL
jgi:phosphoadenosine phosphosulfate reductase